MDIRAEVASAGIRFDALRSGGVAARAFHRSVLRNGKKFVVILARDALRFIPGHYALRGEQVDSLEQRQTIPPVQIQKVLDGAFGPALCPGEPLYAEIDAAYLAYCLDSGATASAHHQDRVYWLVRDTSPGVGSKS